MGKVVAEESVRVMMEPVLLQASLWQLPDDHPQLPRGVTSYIVSIWCTTLFSDILQVSFPYAPESRKAAGRTPKIGRNAQKSTTTTFPFRVASWLPPHWV